MGQGGGCVGKTHMLAITNIPSRLATNISTSFASIFMFIDSNGNFIYSLYESKYFSYHCYNLLTCVRASAWN